jgi:GGDEF domain-containing protein
VTTLLASGVRADDWLGREGTAEFAVVLGGRADAAEVAVDRLVRSVGGVVTGVAACAGIAELERGLHAAEVRRRALLCLGAARAQGPGQLVRYRGTR